MKYEVFIICILLFVSMDCKASGREDSTQLQDDGLIDPVGPVSSVFNADCPKESVKLNEMCVKPQ